MRTAPRLGKRAPKAYTVVVDEQSVLINCIRQDCRSDDVITLYGDLRTKRAEADIQGNRIYLRPADDSVHVNPASTEDTVICIEGLGSGWETVMADVGRYSLRIVIVKLGPKRRQDLWESSRPSGVEEALQNVEGAAS